MPRFGSPRDFGQWISTNLPLSQILWTLLIEIESTKTPRSVKYIFEIFSIDLPFLIRGNWNEEMDVSCFEMVEEFSIEGKVSLFELAR